ncbi:helix-turn-helix domain-containing protein [Paraburkholderia nemoris]|uniref:helix-turn-helix domain-containing protein n=1 Tax=Paraburkholderia nemoris TaxID=2793076 RepID=UPI0038BD9B9C
MIDVSAWSTVAYTGFDQSTRNRFEMRQLAVLRYIDGQSIREIEKSTGVNRRQLYRWLERAQAQHPDGRVFGFRALGSLHANCRV